MSQVVLRRRFRYGARRIAVPLATTLLAVTGCAAGTEEITADTKCDDYIQRPAAERHDAATRISAEVGDVPSAGNPMWGLSLDGACGSSPSMTLGEYFGNAE